MDYQIEIKQIVDYPRCRIYRNFLRDLMEGISEQTEVLDVYKRQRQWSATPVSTGSNPVCASPEGPQKLLVSGVFSCPETIFKISFKFIAMTF